MQAFAELYKSLDASTSTLAKRRALQRYFDDIGALRPEDAAWAVYFLVGGKPRQVAPTMLLRAITRQLAGLPEWLFDECYESVGDLAETIALLLPDAHVTESRPLAEFIERDLLPLRGLEPEAMGNRLALLLSHLPAGQRLVCMKLVTGAFRVGVSRQTVTQALADVTGLDPRLIAQRLVGYAGIGANPRADDYRALVRPEEPAAGSRDGRPYPFFLAHPLNEPADTFDTLLGPPQPWQIEWKWDGIRAQLVRRGGDVWLWSRGEDLITERFPEIRELAAALPDGTVLDGEILVWDANGGDGSPGRVRPFSQRQRRSPRKTLAP
nr:ATP-dependent DNA ligase [Burkholderiaceae bacterium]